MQRGSFAKSDKANFCVSVAWEGGGGGGGRSEFWAKKKRILPEKKYKTFIRAKKNPRRSKTKKSKLAPFSSLHKTPNPSSFGALLAQDVFPFGPPSSDVLGKLLLMFFVIVAAATAVAAFPLTIT